MKRIEENFRNTKPHKPVKLTIDNAQLSIWTCDTYGSSQYLHTMVESIYIGYHRKYFENFSLMLKHRIQVLLEVQFNSQDVFGYMPLPKECFSRYIKVSKSAKKKINHKQQIISESQQGRCQTWRDASKNWTHRKNRKKFAKKCTLSAVQFCWHHTCVATYIYIKLIQNLQWWKTKVSRSANLHSGPMTAKSFGQAHLCPAPSSRLASWESRVFKDTHLLNT